MKYVFVFLMCLMLLFTGVQYNDPDSLMWMAIYTVPAIWCALAAFCTRVFAFKKAIYALMISVAASMAGVIWFWPLMPQFWMKAVWYNIETAREGMGLMIVAVVLFLVYAYVRKLSTPVFEPT